MTADQLKIEMEKMKTEIAIYKRLAGFMSGFALMVALSVGGWTFARADAYAQLTQEVKIHSEVIKRHNKQLYYAEKQQAETKGDIKVIDANMQHIITMTNEIKELVKELAKRK